MNSSPNRDTTLWGSCIAPANCFMQKKCPSGSSMSRPAVAISRALGAGPDLAEDSGSAGTGDDPAYANGGGDTFRYRIQAGDLAGVPSHVTATLYYQATPPFFLQDRFCTAKGADRDRLLTVTTRLDLNGTRAEKWKLDVVGSGSVAVTVTGQ